MRKALTKRPLSQMELKQGSKKLPHRSRRGAQSCQNGGAIVMALHRESVGLSDSQGRLKMGGGSTVSPVEAVALGVFKICSLGLK